MWLISFSVLIASSLYLIVLGLVALIDRQRARRFLGLFAQISRANAIESLCRLLIGAAFVHLGSELPTPAIFRTFGLILIVSALAMLALPGLHKSFANRVVPGVSRLVPLIGLVSLAAGIGLAIILWPLMDRIQSPY